MVIDGSKLQATKISEPFERLIKVFIAPDTQDLVKDISVTMGIIYPHSQNDLHCHEGFELLYIVSGYGKAVLGDETFELKPDCLMVCAPGVMHRQINESDETMKMLAIWTPAVTSEEVLDRAITAAKVQSK
jgi:mannose-6-phosphate isomerase-like protein (cupin superfamily)